MSLDPRAERLLRMLSASQGEGAPESIQARRQGLADLADLAGGAPTADLCVSELIAPGPDGALCLRRYRSKDAGRSALLFLHGGGWVAGSLETHDVVCRRLALESRCQIFALDYRLAPENRFPAGLCDTLCALEWLADSWDALGLDPGRLAIGGDSAGATLAAAAASLARSGRGPSLALQLLICPILDLQEKSPSRRRFADGYFLSEARFRQDLQDYVPEGMDLRDPRLSPIYDLEVSSTPMTLIHAAEYDPFHDEAVAYADRLQAGGVCVNRTVHPGMIHYFYCLSGAIPYAATALSEMSRQLGSALCG